MSRTVPGDSAKFLSFGNKATKEEHVKSTAVPSMPGTLQATQDNVLLSERVL